MGVPARPAVRSDVTKPNKENPCGATVGTNIADALNSVTPVTVNGDGSFTLNATSFNGQDDGSRFFTAKIDPTGTGKSFTDVPITTNGNPAPETAGSQSLKASLPAGTKCTGGKNGKQCLLQLVTKAGFGNCVALTTAATTAAGGAGTPTNIIDGGKSATTPAASHCSAQDPASTTDATPVAPRSGSLLARSFLASLTDSGPGAAEVAKRDTLGGIIVPVI
jgi:hypothetical protein